MTLRADAPVILAAPADWARLCTEGRQLLLDAGCVIRENPFDRPLTPEELADYAANADAAVAGVEVWDGAILDAAPRLKAICKLGVGLDNFDLVESARLGVAVCNAPGSNANAVAEFAVGLILATLRKIPTGNAAARTGDWTRYVGSELAGRSVGLVGFGRIAQTLAKRLIGFEVALRAYDPAPDHGAAAALGVELTELDEVLAASDVISLHLPSVPETRHFAGPRFFGAMRSGAYLVNTARGAVVDEAALLAALESGKLAGAALDVFEHEPLAAHHPLAALPNVVATNHMAADTREAYEKIGVINARAILDVLAGREPQNKAN